MAYSFLEITKLAETKTGREIAAILGVRQPVDSSIPEDRYMNNEGGRIIRAARDQVEAGNGHCLYGEKKSRKSGGNGNSKAAPDPLATIQDIEIVMAARLAAKKAGINENGDGIRDAIESGNAKVVAFLDFALSQEQRAILEKAIGVLSPAEREAKRRSDLIASIRMAVLKAIQVKAMIASIEAIGGTVEMPLWFRDVSSIKPDTLESHSTGELESIAASMPTA